MSLSATVTRSVAAWAAPSSSSESAGASVARMRSAPPDTRSRRSSSIDGIAQRDAHEEAVELRLGERVRAEVLHGILRREDEERLGERPRDAVGGDRALVHRLQERRLRLRSRPVDLVGEEHRREHRARVELELLRPHVEDREAEDVGRQRVRRELDPVDADAERLPERGRERRLSDARHVLDEEVPAREEAHDRVLDGGRRPAVGGPARSPRAARETRERARSPSSREPLLHAPAEGVGRAAAHDEEAVGRFHDDDVREARRRAPGATRRARGCRCRPTASAGPSRTFPRRSRRGTRRRRPRSRGRSSRSRTGRPARSSPSPSRRRRSRWRGRKRRFL